jgi:hypothetical protein
MTDRAIARVALCTVQAAPTGARAENATEETTVEWVCATYPHRVQTLFQCLDLERDGLQDMKAAVARGSDVEACQALLAYYRRGPSGQWLRGPKITETDARDRQADAALNDTFTFYGQTDRVPRKPDGGLVWTHRGPSNDWEWTLALNRHYHVRQLIEAYRTTGNRAYAVRIDEHLRDWIRSSLPYPARKNVGELWRGLEISFRVKAWAQVFYTLLEDERLTSAARLLMLTSLPEHAHHLRHFHGSGNWLTMELSALAMIAAAWPEYKEAPAWLQYASSTLMSELSRQVYPDGVQDELTSSYHRTALVNFEQFAEICRGARIPPPDAFRKKIEIMWDYLARTMRPDGRGLLNNDSDLEENNDRVLQAAERYRRAEWTYIATQGRRGSKPPGGPSSVFPWAGQLVMRSGWEQDAVWAFFDMGPWGSGHQHRDKLHLSVSAYGRDLLVDSGRFTYTGDHLQFRNQYAVLSRAHNVILIDGQGQGPGPLRADKPIAGDDCHIAPEMVFARGSCDHFDALAGKAVHTRAVLYLRDQLIVVADRIVTDRARSLKTLWHWHPRCRVVQDDQTILSHDAGAGNLRIVPVSNFEWRTALVKGQMQPYIQGWYSRQYNEWEPNTTAEMSAAVDGTAAFAWLLLPGRGEPGTIRGRIIANSADVIRIRIEGPGREALTVAIPWRMGKPLAE